MSPVSLREIAVIEPLESRALLSAALLSSSVVLKSPASLTAGSTVVTPIKVVTGPNVNAIAGTPFMATVGFYATPVLDPPLQYLANVNWGDGVTTAAKISYGQSDVKFGIVITGSHTYAKAGHYVITTTLMTGPINPKMGLADTIIEKIVDQGIVAAFPANSSGGLTLAEVPGKSFTAVVGNFTAIAPATDLTAIITWGDGTTSAGKLKATGVSGVDVIKFSVTGTHTYALVGKYPVTIRVYKGAASTAGATPIATIESTVNVLLPPTAV
jgi:hypothetical protein